MSEMIERVAAALALLDGIKAFANEDERSDYAESARVAIEAMRDATEAMSDAVEMERDPESEMLEYPGPYTTWEAMIDAALTSPRQAS